MPGPSRLSNFHHFPTHYKKIGTHQIAVHVYIPQRLSPGKHPLFIKFHGGGLVLGEASYQDWIASYLPSFIQRNNSILIMPNYRLMPEHNGAEIMQDLEDFWQWVSNELQNFVWEKNWEVDIDLDRVLVDGDSAGGLLALNSVLLGSVPENKVKVRAMMVHYPMTNALSRRKQKYGPDGTPTPGLEILAEIEAQVAENRRVISSSTPWKRFPISYGLAAFGKWMHYFGKGNKGLLPIFALDNLKGKGALLPPTLILHAEQDTVVRLGDSKKFVEKVEEVMGDQGRNNVRLVVAEGGHGFDLNLREEDTKWLRDELLRLEDCWLEGEEPSALERVNGLC